MTPHKKNELETMFQMVGEAEEIVTDPTARSMNSGICCTNAGNSKGRSRKRSRIPISMKSTRRGAVQALSEANCWVRAAADSCCSSSRPSVARSYEHG